MRHALVAATLLIFMTAPVWADEEEVMARIESIHGDAAGFAEIFGQVQDAFLFDDPTSIADLAFYPLTVNANGEAYDVQEAQDLIDNFDTLMTPNTRAALARQDFDDLIVTSEGVGLANGALWISNVCVDDSCAQTQWRIISINN